MSDKRSVSTDALAVLGTLINETVGRDAIHLAVEPVVAGERLTPGQDIGIIDGKAYNKGVKHVGIVDPFLAEVVEPGQRFLLIVYPRQITSLRHVWSHPDFDEEEIVVKEAVTIKTKGRTAKEIAKQWLEAYADGIDVSYESLIEVADSHQGNGYGDYIIQGGRFEGESTPDEFWDNYAIVKGVTNPKIASFFSCSC
jgi:hypothetical protein